MNIFILDDNVKTAAEYHCDAHVVKMILELAQLLCTAHSVLASPTCVADNADFFGKLYKATHTNHPCAKWVRSSRANYVFTYQLFVALSKEYTHRYGKEHVSYTKLKDLLVYVPDDIPDVGFTEPAQAMPDDVKIVGDAVGAYRKYYNKYKQFKANNKQNTYTNRQKPEWLQWI